MFKNIFVYEPIERISFSYLFELKIWKKFEQEEKLKSLSKMYTEIETEKEKISEFKVREDNKRFFQQKKDQ